MAKGRPAARAALGVAGSGQGLIWLKRVAQLPRAVRVPPQLPTGLADHCASVHVWLMYSDAIQIEPPSATAAP